MIDSGEVSQSDNKANAATVPDIADHDAWARVEIALSLRSIASDTTNVHIILDTALRYLEINKPEPGDHRQNAELLVNLLFGGSHALTECIRVVNNAAKLLTVAFRYIHQQYPRAHIPDAETWKNDIKTYVFSKIELPPRPTQQDFYSAYVHDISQLNTVSNMIRFFELVSDVSLHSQMMQYCGWWASFNFIVYYVNYRCAITVQAIANNIDKTVYDEVFGIGELANDPIILANTRTPATTARLPVQCIPKRGSTQAYINFTAEEITKGLAWFPFSRMYETLKTCIYMPWVTFNPFDPQQRHPEILVTPALEQSYDHTSNYYLDYLLKYPVIAKLHRPAHYPCCEVFYPFKHEFQRPLPDIAEQVRRFYNSNTFRKVESLAKRLRERPIYHVVYFRECVHDEIEDVFAIPFAHCLADHLNPLGYTELEKVYYFHTIFSVPWVTSAIMVNISLTVRIGDPVPRSIALNGAINTGVFEPFESVSRLVDDRFYLPQWSTPLARQYDDIIYEQLQSRLTMPEDYIPEVAE